MKFVADVHDFLQHCNITKAILMIFYGKIIYEHLAAQHVAENRLEQSSAVRFFIVVNSTEQYCYSRFSMIVGSKHL